MRQKIWTSFEYSIMNCTDLMKDRHLDQILMCAVYVVCKVVETERSFTDIMRCYRQQPQATSDVYRSVLLGPSTTNTTPSDNTNNFDNVPNVPVTPGQMAGTARNYPTGERGDLIRFYNTIYIQQIQSFVLRFSQQVNIKSFPCSIYWSINFE